MQEFVNYIVNLADQMGYLGIFLMMVLESSFIPFPSEVAMIPA
jgi:membrane protein YqaA with SNARE-associated domain